MRLHRKAIGLLVLAQLAPVLAWAQNPAIDTLFPSRPTGYLTDAAHLVDPASAAAIEELAAKVRGATGAEIAVVTLPTIGDRAPVEVATEIGRVWKVGAAAAIGDATRNAGVVLLLVPRQDHRAGSGHLFIATGRGVEGFITDSRAGAVRDLMGPELADEQYGPALLTGTRAIASLIARGFNVTDSTIVGWPVGGNEGGGGGGNFPWSLLFVALFIILSVINRGRRGRWGGSGIYWGGGFGGGFGGGGGGGGGFGGFGGGGGFSGGGGGGSF